MFGGWLRGDRSMRLNKELSAYCFLLHRSHNMFKTVTNNCHRALNTMLSVQF